MDAQEMQQNHRQVDKESYMKQMYKINCNTSTHEINETF